MITEGVAIKVPQVMHEHSGRCAVGVMQSPNCNYLSPALQCPTVPTVFSLLPS